MSGCACLPLRICPWDLKFRLNFFLPNARNEFEFAGLFAIALCIFTESSFWWTQINTEIVGPMSARLQAIKPLSPSELATDPSGHSIVVAKSPSHSLTQVKERKRPI